MKDYNKYKLVIVTLVIELHYFIVSEIPQRLKEPLESSNYPEKMASKFLPFISKVNKQKMRATCTFQTHVNFGIFHFKG